MAKGKQDEGGAEIVFDDLHPGVDDGLDAQLDEEGLERGKGALKTLADEEEFEIADDPHHGDVDDDDEDLGGGKTEIVASEDDDDDEDEPLTRKQMEERIATLRSEVRAELNEGGQEVVRRANAKIDRLTKQLDLSKSRDAAQSELATIDGDIASVKKDLEDAIERGKSGAQIELTDKLTDLKAKRTTVQAKIEKAADDIKELESKKDDELDIGDGAGGGQQQQQQKPISEEGKRNASAFIEKNKGWYGSNEEATAYCRFIDRTLAAKGIDPGSKEYWDQLQSRVHRAYPDAVPAPEDSGDGGGKPDKNAGGGARQVVRGGGGVRRKSRRVTLTRRHLRNMERFGLDPSNPVHQKEYAASVRESSEA